ncbi:neural cell adhesion molecule 1, partial [Biomphalaria pfeifferi]
PPRPVTNITALEITHEAVQLMWIPGPNGGVEQLFNLEYRCLNNRICGSNWMPAILAVAENITQANLANLKPATEYEIRVVSTNSHGSTESQPLLVRIGERIVMTTSVPQTDQSNTLMAVVIFSVVTIFIVIITIYELVQKCKCGRCKSGGP